MISEKRIVSIVRWTARISGLCIFVFWGGFFVDDLYESIIVPFPHIPPLHVWLSLMMFVIMLAGFIVALKVGSSWKYIDHCWCLCVFYDPYE